MPLTADHVRRQNPKRRRVDQSAVLDGERLVEAHLSS